MPNFVESIGYSSGKLHTGLLAYLCDLFESGQPEPLNSFFNALDVPLPENATAKREWQSVDLAIFGAPDKPPHVLIEMKVMITSTTLAEWVSRKPSPMPKKRPAQAPIYL